MKTFMICLFVMLFPFYFGCFKDYSEIEECLKNNFTIPSNIPTEPDSGAYFYGQLNENKIAFENDSIITTFNSDYYNGATTPADNPSWSPDSTYTFRGLFFGFSSTKNVDDPGFFAINIRGPRVDISTFDHKQELDKFESLYDLQFKTGNNGLDKYRLSILYSCQKADQYLIDHSHKQPNDSHFRVARFKRTDVGLGWKYDIAFDIKMVMYFRDEDEVERKLGCLEGVFSTVTYIWQ